STSGAPTDVDVLRVQGPDGQERVHNEPAEGNSGACLASIRAKPFMLLETALCLIKAWGPRLRNCPS
ncbi:hypothetical protein EJB05_01477, partial [Eragrostis curvula]